MGRSPTVTNVKQNQIKIIHSFYHNQLLSINEINKLSIRVPTSLSMKRSLKMTFKLSWLNLKVTCKISLNCCLSISTILSSVNWKSPTCTIVRLKWWNVGCWSSKIGRKLKRAWTKQAKITLYLFGIGTMDYGTNHRPIQLSNCLSLKLTLDPILKTPHSTFHSKLPIVAKNAKISNQVKN